MRLESSARFGFDTGMASDKDPPPSAMRSASAPASLVIERFEKFLVSRFDVEPLRNLLRNALGDSITNQINWTGPKDVVMGRVVVVLSQNDCINDPRVLAALAAARPKLKQEILSWSKEGEALNP